MLIVSLGICGFNIVDGFNSLVFAGLRGFICGWWECFLGGFEFFECDVILVGFRVFW